MWSNFSAPWNTALPCSGLLWSSQQSCPLIKLLWNVLIEVDRLHGLPPFAGIWRVHVISFTKSSLLTALRPRVTSTKLTYRNTISTTFYRGHLQKKNTSVVHHAISLKVTLNTRSAWVEVWRTHSTILKVSLCRLQISTWISQERPLWGCGKCCGNGIIMIMSGTKVQNGLVWQSWELFVALLFFDGAISLLTCWSWVDWKQKRCNCRTCRSLRR